MVECEVPVWPILVFTTNCFSSYHKVQISGRCTPSCYQKGPFLLTCAVSLSPKACRICLKSETCSKLPLTPLVFKYESTMVRNSACLSFKMRWML